MSEHDVHVSRKPAVEIFFCRHFVKIAARGQTTPRARGRRFPIKLTLQFSSSTITQIDAHAAPALPAPPYRAGGVALSAPAVFRLPAFVRLNFSPGCPSRTLLGLSGQPSTNPPCQRAVLYRYRRSAVPKWNSPIVGRRRVLQGTAVVSAATLVPSLAAKSQNVPKVTPVTDELTADEIVTLLKLEPNATCGFVRVTFVSKQSIAAGGLPAPFAEGRPLGSALYFMVTSGAPVRLHRIRNEQLYHYYLGDPLSPNASKWTRKKFASWDRKACSCARSLPLQARKRRVLALPVLYRSGAPDKIRTPDPQIRSLVLSYRAGASRRVRSIAH